MKLVCGKPHNRNSFWYFSKSGKGGADRIRTVLSGSRKRTDIPYHLTLKSILFGFKKIK